MSEQTTQHRPIHLIAREIERDWGSKIYFGAEPYLSAMHGLNRIHDMFYQDTASSVVAYFLSNATTWRGEKAREIKKELNQMLKDHRDGR